MSVNRRRVASLAALPVLSLVVMGCGEVREQTQTWREPLDGASASAGLLDIRNAVIVTDSEGQATVLASFANRGAADDALSSVNIDGSNGEPAGGPLDIPAHGHASITPDATRVDVSGVELEPGRAVEVEFIFAEARRATLTTVVQSADGLYATAFEEPAAEQPPTSPE